MKTKFFLACIISLLTAYLSAQDCSIISKANDITPDRLCSPVTVIWKVSFRGVNNAGTSVKIRFDWDDGSVETYNAVNIDPSPANREWEYIATHVYTSDDDKCNYHPEATIVVNGQRCTSSTQEQIVTVWDNDNTNGGELKINPEIYPICFGNGADVKFRDVTLFNCVPPQEKDVPNLSTRWIQWVYGTDITMTGIPVTINDTPRIFPFYGDIRTLPGPVTGSGIFSEMINVENDKFIGQHFEVTLRYWNYCNPYDDPLIPGPPADLINGDNSPVTTTAIILIVPYPDAEITPVDPLCLYSENIHLSAADGGGIWSGKGIENSNTGEFSPSLAGTGEHVIRYEITDGNSCSDWDTVVISILPAPTVNILPADPFCTYQPAVNLETVPPLSGTWSGSGIQNSNNSLFDPSLAGAGIHEISFTSDPDAQGCSGKDSIEIEVNDKPDAYIITDNSSWCGIENADSFALIKIDGSRDLNYDLEWKVNGVPETIYGIDSDSLRVQLFHNTGETRYELSKIVEHFDENSCENILNDELIITILPMPEMTLNLNPSGGCSPVTTTFSTESSNGNKFIWNFGDGTAFTGDTSFVAHTFYNFGNGDTTYNIGLTIETSDGCGGSINKDLVVYPNPRADFFVTPAIQDYPSTNVLISNYSSNGNWQYSWSFGDGESSDVKQPNNHTYETYGEYSIRLTTYSEYCSDTTSRTIRILPPPPEAAFTPDTSGCSPLTVTFNNQSIHGESYLWDFDDGSFSNEPNPTHTFYNSKDYQVKLLVTGVRGSSEAKHTIRVFPFPSADFNSYPESATRTDQVFKFINTSERAVSYFWEFGDGSFSTEKSPSYVYDKEGEFDVTLFVMSEHNCPDTLMREKYIKVISGEGLTIFPNVFRWNRSGSTGGYWYPNQIDNTVFHPNFENVEEFEMLIYSRWGELLYKSDDIYKGWDGYTINGALAPQGVYVFKAWVLYNDGTKEIKAGDVTFLH